MKKFLIALLLLSTVNVFADDKRNSVIGKRAVLKASNQLKIELSKTQSLNAELTTLRNKHDIESFKNDYLHAIFDMREHLDQLERSVENLRLAPPLTVTNCVVNEQDHGGLLDRGGSIIYKRKRDIRICARVISRRPSLQILSAELLVNGTSIASLQALRIPTGSNAYEGKAKKFSYKLPTVSSNQYTRCVPEFATDLRIRVKNSKNGNRRTLILPINPELINYNGRSKYRVNMCD